MKFFKKIFKEKGIALVTVLSFVPVLLLLLGCIVKETIAESYFLLREKRSEQVFYLTEAGIDMAYSIFSSNNFGRYTHENENTRYEDNDHLFTGIPSYPGFSRIEEGVLVLPPKIAPIHVVIVPIYKTVEEMTQVMEACKKIKDSICNKYTVKIDDRDSEKPGAKFFEWEKKGVPLRVELGPRDLAKGQVVLARRDLGTKLTVPMGNITSSIDELLTDIQKTLFEKHKKLREDNTVNIDNYADFKNLYEKNEAFVRAGWCKGSECEEKIKEDTKATIRSLPMDGREEPGNCICCGKPSNIKVIFSKAY